MVTRGDVCWCETPEAGRRPVLILTRATAVPVLRRVLVAPLTRTIRNLPTEVRLGEADGVPDECVISFDNLEQAYKESLSEPIASLSGPLESSIARAIVFSAADG